MHKEQSTLPKDSKQSKGKPSNWQGQCQRLSEALSAMVLTASMATTLTGLKQKNICRIKRQLEKAGLLWVVRIAPCAETGRRAQWLTTDPNRKPEAANQLNLFSDNG